MIALILLIGSSCVTVARAETPIDSYFDDFSSDSGLWEYVGNAQLDPINDFVCLTNPNDWEVGAIFFDTTFTSHFIANFSYLIGGGTGADGITIFFYKQHYSVDSSGWESTGAGSEIGFDYLGTPIPGYGVEFDGYPHNENDSPENHIAIIKDSVNNHLLSVDDPRVEDDTWHDACIMVNQTSIMVYVDNDLVLDWTGAIDRSYTYFGFSGSTGGSNNWHLIDNVSLQLFSSVQLPVPETPCGTLAAIAIPILALATYKYKTRKK